MYFNYQKIKNNRRDMMRFKDSIARFTFIQLSFGVYEYIQNRFDIVALINRIMFSHIGIAGFNLISDFIK